MFILSNSYLNPGQFYEIEANGSDVICKCWALKPVVNAPTVEDDLSSVQRKAVIPTVIG